MNEIENEKNDSKDSQTTTTTNTTTKYDDNTLVLMVQNTSHKLINPGTIIGIFTSDIKPGETGTFKLYL